MDNITLGQLINNRNFDVNCRYRVYLGIWNDGGELLYDSYDPEYEFKHCWLDYNVQYITLDTDNMCIVIEVG